MQSVGQRYYREKLAKLVSKTTLLDLVGMTWCGWAIQNGHSDDAKRYMDFSPEARDGSAGARLGIYPWQLETLVNEALVAPHRTDGRQRTLVTQEFSAIFRLAKLIQRIEEVDDRAFLKNHDVLYELHRLTQRQFEWQRGYINMPRCYRTLTMFGEGAAATYFERKVGCTVPEFIEAGFFLFSGHSSSPSRIWKNHDVPNGVDPASVTRALNHISISSSAASGEALRLRADGEHIGYKPSILRQHPIFRFGVGGEDAMAPLPPLILQRITSGLYLDIVEGGGAVWQDVGRRFETYCLKYLGAMLGGFSVEPERRYGSKGRGFDTPDVLAFKDGGVRLVVECKAKRMPVDARFSGDPVSDSAAAYAEIAKGVFQVWRFFSHVRRGILDLKLAANCVGAVVTADPWLVMGQKLHPEVMTLANQIADEKDPEIIEVDRRRVPIVMIDDVEYALQHASVDQFLDRLDALAADETGWAWSIVHGIEHGVDRPYPFANELSRRLPWLYASH